jgi:hypothetical protein
MQDLIGGDEACLHGVQGKHHHLGTFLDPVSAAICYDREATKKLGPNADLNFPLHRICSPTSTGAAGQPAVVTNGGLRDEGGPAANGSLPAGSAGGNPATVCRVGVRLAS